MRRKLLHLLAVAALAAAGLILGTTGSHAVAAATWTTVWQADFTGTAGTGPSTDNWRYDVGPGSNYGTGEVESTTNSTANVALDGKGDLAITPRRDGSGNWTSGRIETNREDFAAPAGGQLKVEARIQLPAVTGAAAEGYWPAFWMLGTPLRHGSQWPDVGEFDALEDVNGQNLTYGTLHCGVNPGGQCNEPNGRGGNRSCPNSSCAGNWHTYTFIQDRSVSPEQLRWYVDGQQYWAVDASQFDATTWNDATHHGVFVILDLAIGGGFPNGVAGHSTPTGATDPGHPMLVDYVSVQNA